MEFLGLESSEEKLGFAKSFLEFLNEACTAFHAVEASKKRYVAAGFYELSESEEWKLSAGGKYFFIRNSTTILAFVVGKNYQPGNGFTCIGAHTDSPCLKIKPVACSKKSDVLVLNTQPYGGGLWHTWFDRDLGLAGRVLYKEADNMIKSKLVRIDRPIARIPNLAIHLSRGPHDKPGFDPNVQEHCQAFLSTHSSLLSLPPLSSQATSRVHPCLAALISETASIDPNSILDMELQLMDVQPPCLGGAASEFLYSGRLDNLCSSYQSLRALIDNSTEDVIDTQTTITMVMLFDHEEVGSSSGQGAGSSLFMNTFRLILSQLGDPSNLTLTRSLHHSFIISADMAHALHPNYAGKHDPTLSPKLNSGLVIKHNANQRYATNSISAVLFREFALLANVPVQEFAVRSDMGCGSTIGPIMATLTGILTVDVGSPQLSMHSIREMMGTEDVHSGYLHFKSALANHAAVAGRIQL